MPYRKHFFYNYLKAVNKKENMTRQYQISLIWPPQCNSAQSHETFPLIIKGNWLKYAWLRVVCSTPRYFPVVFLVLLSPLSL